MKNRLFKKAAAVLTAVTLLLSTAGFAGSSEVFTGKVDLGGYGVYAEYHPQGALDEGQTAAKQCKGKPLTVVFDTGYGDDSSTMSDLRNAVNPFANTLIYDRAGLGQSDASLIGRTSADKARELHLLLKKRHLNKVVYVVHSVSAMQAVIHANTYKDDISAILFIDGSHPAQSPYFEGLFVDDPEGFEEFKSIFQIDGTWEDIMTSSEQAQKFMKPGKLKKLPITVLTATDPEDSSEMATLWLQWQNEIAALSKNSVHHINNPDDSSKVYTHYIHMDDPEFVVDQIQALIKRVR